jgi:hypothetical protein
MFGKRRPSKNRAHRKTHYPRVPLSLDYLEDRLTPSVTFLGVAAGDPRYRRSLGLLTLAPGLVHAGREHFARTQGQGSSWRPSSTNRRLITVA